MSRKLKINFIVLVIILTPFVLKYFFPLYINMAFMILCFLVLLFIKDRKSN